ncbi:hypothetical protein IVA94_39340 [Bradyrhizobium sp. 156]|nr:hypothetical protein [Bradyrhizobium sp. 156]MCK1326702.1 hypothetical protein [Bradyrhizobium sp. 156]
MEWYIVRLALLINVPLTAFDPRAEEVAFLHFGDNAGATTTEVPSDD